MGDKKPRARRLKKIAEWVNEHQELLGLKASIGPTSVWKERRAPGLRYTFGGRSVDGTLLEFRATRKLVMPEPDGRTIKARELVHSHNSAETYRENADVERWLARFVTSLPAATRRKLGAEAVVWARLGYGY